MRNTPLIHRARIALTLGLTVALIIGGLGVAIELDAGPLRTVDLSYGGIHIVAYRTPNPECRPYAPCDPEPGAPRAYYVVWSVGDPSTANQPSGITAKRLIAVPLTLSWSGP